MLHVTACRASRSDSRADSLPDCCPTTVRQLPDNMGCDKYMKTLTYLYTARHARPKCPPVFPFSSGAKKGTQGGSRKGRFLCTSSDEARAAGVGNDRFVCSRVSEFGRSTLTRMDINRQVARGGYRSRQERRCELRLLLPVWVARLSWNLEHNLIVRLHTKPPYGSHCTDWIDLKDVLISSIA